MMLRCEIFCLYVEELNKNMSINQLFRKIPTKFA